MQITKHNTMCTYHLDDPSQFIATKHLVLYLFRCPFHGVFAGWDVPLFHGPAKIAALASIFEDIDERITVENTHLELVFGSNT